MWTSRCLTLSQDSWTNLHSTRVSWFPPPLLELKQLLVWHVMCQKWRWNSFCQLGSFKMGAWHNLHLSSLKAIWHSQSQSNFWFLPVKLIILEALWCGSNPKCRVYRILRSLEIFVSESQWLELPSFVLPPCTFPWSTWIPFLLTIYDVPQDFPRVHMECSFFWVHANSSFVAPL